MVGVTCDFVIHIVCITNLCAERFLNLTISFSQIVLLLLNAFQSSFFSDMRHGKEAEMVPKIANIGQHEQKKRLVFGFFAVKIFDASILSHMVFMQLFLD